MKTIQPLLCLAVGLLAVTARADGIGGARLLVHSPDGALVATAHEDRDVRVWEAANHKLSRTLTAHGDTVTQVSFSADSDTIATGCADGKVRLWDVSSGELLRIMVAGGPCAAFSADGKTLTTCDADGAPVHWDWGHMGPDLRLHRLGVDLRPKYERWDLWPVRQGKRGTCSAFATAWAFEYALSRRLGRGAPLSVEFLNWASNVAINDFRDGGFFHHLLKGFEQSGICPEADLPYQAKFDPDLKPPDEALRHAETIRDLDFAVHWTNPWKPQAGLTDGHMSEIKAILDAGWPVAAGSHHSRMLVGYVDDPDGPGKGWFLTRDSGFGGYGEVTYDWVQEKVGDVFWVELPEGAQVPQGLW